MRSIIFRARQVENDQWVYGYGIWNDCDSWHILTPSDSWYILTPKKYAVDPETIEQYTGLEDKKGWCIYEGDRLKGVTDDGEEFYCTVIWHNYGFCLRDEQSGITDPLEDADGKLYEVVGNIYDKDGDEQQ